MNTREKNIEILNSVVPICDGNISIWTNNQVEFLCFRGTSEEVLDKMIEELGDSELEACDIKHYRLKKGERFNVHSDEYRFICLELEAYKEWEEMA